MANTKLLLIEEFEDAKIFVNNLDNNKDIQLNECDILSFQPDIQSLLKSNGIECFNSSQFSSPRLYHDVMDHLDKIENHVKNIICENNVLNPDPWFVDAFNYYFRYVCFHLIWNVEIIYKVLDNKKYNLIVTFKGDKNLHSSPWILSEERLMSNIAAQICSALKIEHYSINRSDKSTNNPSNNIKNSILDKLCINISFNIYKILASNYKKRLGLFVLNFAKNFDSICRDLIIRNSKIQIYSFNKSKINGTQELKYIFLQLIKSMFPKNINLSQSTITSIKISLDIFYKIHKKQYDNRKIRIYNSNVLAAISNNISNVTRYRSIDIHSLLYNKIINDIIPYLIGLDIKIFSQKKVLELFKPEIVLSNSNLGLSSALGYLSTDLNIKSVLISHGSHVKHNDVYSSKENEILARNLLVGGYEYLAVQSPLAKEMAVHLKNKSSKIVNIKPIVWGVTPNKSTHNNPDYLTIIHAGSFKSAQRRFMYETSDEIFKGIKDLCDVVSTKNNIKLIIKFRFGPEFSQESLDILLPHLSENISIETEKSFLNILSEVDMLVSFSSTTIEEALVNKIPVLLYGGNGRYAHIPVEPYSDQNNDIYKPVTFIKNKHHLEEYFTKLDEAGPNFRVPNEKFNKYRFSDDEAVDFSDWFSNLIKTSL